MNIRIKTSDYEMPTKVSLYLAEKLVSLEKLLGADADTTRCEVELGRATGRHKHSEYQWFAEIQVKQPGMPRLVARNHESAINAAIDNAKDEMLRQLRKSKTSRATKTRKAGAKTKRLLKS
ncbi:HPF/RaiA family ribosome-associated protein [Candidatus Kaiserbacteria bacterium]|nr:HPF/RaiA family ribosome-associated protein [Candidatus Kaiserbacteria bacterium]